MKRKTRVDIHEGRGNEPSLQKGEKASGLEKLFLSGNMINPLENHCHNLKMRPISVLLLLSRVGI